MDILPLVETLWPGVLFALAIFILTFSVRKVVEGVWPKIKVNRYWADVVMPSLPVVLGVVGALALKPDMYPYPEVLKGSAAYARVRFILGLCGGWFSSWVVRVVNAWVKAKTGIDLEVVTVSATTTTETKTAEVSVSMPKPADPGGSS